MKWMRSRLGWWGVGVLLLMAVGACGGGGGGDGPSVLYGSSTSVAPLDGWVRTDGVHDATGIPMAGDLDLNVPGEDITACYTFTVQGIAPGSHIVSATLSVDVIGADGDPFAQHGDMRAHYLPYGNSLANVGSIAVFDPPPPAVFSPANVAPGTKRADVRALLQRAVNNGSTELQVQIGFFAPISVVNSLNDFVMLSDGENVAGGALPRLEWEWTAP